MRVSIFLLLLLGACQPRERSGCPPDLASFGRNEALRAAPASLPNQTCELDAADLRAYGAGREAGLARLCGGTVAFARGLDRGPFDINLCPAVSQEEARRAFETGQLLQGQIAQRDALMARATEAEAKLAALAADAPERRNLEDEAAGLRFDARQRENDIEALRGVAAVEKWR